ncbi:MAG: ribose 5-phosphate isomerase A [Promethearchaeota archaeon Loki_b32]|nr:MAG: ribose 5-phosphate isomerase A [Candidatus Lokiarchaeota archaeon Loki_b32]
MIILTENLIELGKKNAAIKAVEENIKKNMIVGIGSGSTVVYAVERLGEINKEKAMNIKCIPSSFQAYQLIIQNGLELVSLEQYSEIDIDIDGADEIDKDLNLIKGGGGCLVQEKIIASNSKELIIIVDFRKNSKILGTNWKRGIPIEVIPMAYFPLMNKLIKIDGNPVLRMARSKSGPLITDNGNFIIDVDFGEIKKPQELNLKLLNIPGIVDTGLFIDMTSKVYVGLEDGNVLTLPK